MIQAFFDEQTDDAVRVKDKVSTRRVLVPDNSVQRLQLRVSTKRKYG